MQRLMRALPAKWAGKAHFDFVAPVDHHASTQLDTAFGSRNDARPYRTTNLSHTRRAHRAFARHRSVHLWLDRSLCTDILHRGHAIAGSTQRAGYGWRISFRLVDGLENLRASHGRTAVTGQAVVVADRRLAKHHLGGGHWCLLVERPSNSPSLFHEPRRDIVPDACSGLLANVENSSAAHSASTLILLGALALCGRNFGSTPPGQPGTLAEKHKAKQQKFDGGITECRPAGHIHEGGYGTQGDHDGAHNV